MTLAIDRLLYNRIPGNLRANFTHLYWDIAWFGVLSGSAISFLNVYAVRLGASPFQLGLLTALPGLATLVLAFPTGRWVQSHRLKPTVVWASVLHRLGYLVWVLLPVLLSAQSQVWALAAVLLLMHVPGTALAIGFNALFADLVPVEHRGQVVGVRNAFYAVGYVGSALLSGFILNVLAFQPGYQLVFGIGAVAALMSSLHLSLLKLPDDFDIPVGERSDTYRRINDVARPGMSFALGAVTVGRQVLFGMRSWARPRPNTRQILKVLGGPLRGVFIGLLLYQTALFAAGPVFSLHWVNVVGLSDLEISYGTALFYVLMFAASPLIVLLSERTSNQRLTATGIFMLGLFTIVSSSVANLGTYLLALSFGGLCWALANSAAANYILEHIPANERADYLAWVSLIGSAALLIGAFAGSGLARWLDPPLALMVIGAWRILSAAVIWRWGD